MKKEIIITLTQPLKYSKDGEFFEESVLILRAPNISSSLTRKNARYLKNLGLVALRKAQEIQIKSDMEITEHRGETSGKDFMIILGMGGFDTNELIDAMKKLAPAVTAIGETNVPFSSTHWERLSMDDEEEITGKYLHDFLLNFDASGSVS